MNLKLQKPKEVSKMVAKIELLNSVLTHSDVIIRHYWHDESYQMSGRIINLYPVCKYSSTINSHKIN